MEKPEVLEDIEKQLSKMVRKWGPDIEVTAFVSEKDCWEIAKYNQGNSDATENRLQIEISAEIAPGLENGDFILKKEGSDEGPVHPNCRSWTGGGM